jgi:hypothetical protein
MLMIYVLKGEVEVNLLNLLKVLIRIMNWRGVMMGLGYLR